MITIQLTLYFGGCHYFRCDYIIHELRAGFTSYELHQNVNRLINT